jgi:hypothetical protein
MPNHPCQKTAGALLLLLAIAPSLLWAADLLVQLDRNRLSAHETLSMRLIADGGASGEPDFTPLTQDFDILSRGQSKTTSIVNGAMSQTREWNLELAPKRTGRLVIPPLSLGHARSQAVTVEVGEQDAGASDAGPRPLFVRATAATMTPYVQQAFDYRVRVYFQAQPQQATLSDPVAEGANIERSGDDLADEEVIDGQRYNVIERRYQVIPNRSGQLRIQGPRLDAVVPDTNPGSQRDPFADLDDAFGGSFFQGFPTIQGLGHPGRRVVERAEDLEIRVRAQPDGSDAHWLPATSVQLSDEWTPAPAAFRVGEPLTRTLTITAQGVTAAQLPNLDLGALDGVQVYADQPRSEDLSGSAHPTAIKSFKVALVPTRAGALTLPEIRLHWWDTSADAPRVAVVPARTVEVAGAPSTGAQPPLADLPPTGGESTPIQQQPETAPTAPPDRAARGYAGLWPWLALLLGCAWLGTLIWWRRERRSRLTGDSSGDGRGRTVESLSAARRQIESACLSNDARAARAALMAWSHIRWPGQAPQGLGELSMRVGGDDIAAILNAIDRAIYAPPTEVWDGVTAWKQLAPRLDDAAKAASARAGEPLPELYPNP